MQQKYKNNIFKEIITSITKFEEYEEFAAQKLKNTILYILKITIISSFILSTISSIKCFCLIEDILNEFKEKVYSINYEDNNLSINNDNYVQIQFKQIINIIIDTSKNSNEIDKKELIQKIDSQGNNIFFLKNECIIKDLISQDLKEYNYQEMKKNGIEINQIFYNTIINEKSWIYLSYLVIFIIFLISLFIICGINIIIDLIFFTFISKVTSWILRVTLNLKENFNISAHAITLSVLLQNIYISVNIITGFNVKYFSAMYIGVAYIYIITAILMIKTEIIKRKIEVDKIIEEQNNIKNEFKEWEKESESKETHKEEIHKKKNK